MISFVKTDIGRKRDINQDFIYYIEEKKFSIYILADGMGGYTGGEVASSIAGKVAMEYIKKNIDIIDNNIDNDDIILKILKNATIYANKQVYNISIEDDELSTMGTTLDICFITKEKTYISHIGDSRVYLIRNKKMTKITKDHTLVEKLIENKKITKKEALVHPKKNMIIKAVGVEKVIKPDLIVEKNKINDIILMCSDGLTNMIAEQEILNIITNNFPNATNILVNKANDLGGYDNISIILLKNI